MPCLPVKITDKQWADKLQDGSVFMRSLHEYGSWSAIKRAHADDTLMKTGVQADISEGIVRRVDPNVGDVFFNSLDPELRAVMKDCMYIDQNLYQYFKIYCMYGLTYLIDQHHYETPDSRLIDFGNTAVIFLDPNEFLHRLIQGLAKQFGDNINFRLDEVRYYPPDYYGDLDEFCKPLSYAWQHEFRIRVALLDGSNTITGEDGQVRKTLIQDTNPIIVDIGDIRDISVQIPTQDLIDLNLPEVIRDPHFTLVEG